MAIFEQVECNVTINGEDAQEYECPPDHDASVAEDESITGPLVENYIESQPGQNFAIRLYLPKGYDFKTQNALTGYVDVDGVRVISPLTRKGDVATAAHRRLICGLPHSVGGEQLEQKFRFSKLDTDKAANSKSSVDIERLAKLGMIRITFYRSKCASMPSSKETEETTKAMCLSVSEKQVKGRALDSFTSFDAPTRTAALNYYDTTDEAIPLVTFVFHYRSKAILQRLGVLEVPICERPLEDRDPATLTHVEVLELLRRKEDVLRQQEDTEKLMKKQLRQARAKLTLNTLDAIKRPRTPSPGSNTRDNDDDEVHIVKRAKKDRKIEIVELD